MSKRHTTSRRRTYGRRQHELHERVDRRGERRADRVWRAHQQGAFDALGYIDGSGGEQPYGFAD